MLSILIIYIAIWISIGFLAYIGNIVNDHQPLSLRDSCIVALFMLLLPALVAVGAAALI